MFKIIIFIFISTPAIAFEFYEGFNCTDVYADSPGNCMLEEKCTSLEEDLKSDEYLPTYCGFDGLVCCRNKSETLQPEIDVRIGSDDDSPRVSIRKCEEYSKPVVKKIEFFPLVFKPILSSVSFAECNFTSKELILGGDDAKLGEFPHMAAVGWDNDGSFKYMCGGTLISPRFVLTAGHCTYAPKMVNPVPVVVKLGAHNINPDVEDANPIVVPIKNITKHPDYKPPRRYDDIALLELDDDVTITHDVRPACLWIDDDFGEKEKAIATGWGVSDPVKHTTSDVLQKVVLSIFANELCNDTLVGTLSDRNWDGFVDTQICAGDLRENKDTCQGDSGAALQVRSVNNSCIYYVIGVTSFGSKICGKKPAVYTRVSKYVDWIESIVWPGE